MAIRKVTPDTQFRVGQIVMTEGILRFGICGWPCEVIAVNKSRLTLKRLRTNPELEDKDPVKFTKSIKFVADTEEEAFAFHQAHWVHAKNAELRLADLERQINADADEILSKHGIVLESLIEQYEKAIRERNQEEIDRLIVLVEKEADKIGYDKHGRLAHLHTLAERAGESGT
jgi:hypothetical protein